MIFVVVDHAIKECFGVHQQFGLRKLPPSLWINFPHLIVSGLFRLTDLHHVVHHQACYLEHLDDGLRRCSDLLHVHECADGDLLDLGDGLIQGRQSHCEVGIGGRLDPVHFSRLSGGDLLFG